MTTDSGETPCDNIQTLLFVQRVLQRGMWLYYPLGNNEWSVAPAFTHDLLDGEQLHNLELAKRALEYSSGGHPEGIDPNLVRSFGRVALAEASSCGNAQRIVRSRWMTRSRRKKNGIGWKHQRACHTPCSIQRGGFSSKPAQLPIS